MTLSELIGSYALSDFKSLTESSGMKSPTARFFQIPELSQTEAVVKVFTTSDAERLFWQELTALYALRLTGRVSPVISDALRHHPKFWEPDFRGPFFIAKPYFPLTLDAALGTATPIEKLDLAAQRVDIARIFLQNGWRDYDWHPSNDVVDNDGRVLRIDLDSVLGQRPLPIKSRLREPDYFSRGEREALDSLVKERKLFFERSEPLEVSNMAIRLCSFFFDENEQTELVRQLQTLQPNEVVTEMLPGAIAVQSSSTIPKRSFGWVRRTITKIVFFFAYPGTNSIKPDPTSTKESTVPCDIESWLDLWRRQSPVTLDPTPSQFSRSEWEILARLSYHLIAINDHGFTLDDLYMSLLLIEFSVMKDRRNRAATLGQHDAASLEKLMPHVGPTELLGTLAVASSANDSYSRNVEPQPTAQGEPRARNIKTSIESDAKACAAVGKEHSEDGALVIEGISNQFAIVTDGASNASGREAAAIALREFESWTYERVLQTPEEAVSEIRSVLFRINTRLIEASKSSGNPHQAMAVIAVVGTSDKECFIAYGQAGDSQCVVFQPDTSLRGWTKSWTTCRLGEYESLPQDKIFAEFVVLNETDAGDGKYRVRLYSDGVSAQGFDSVRRVPDVHSLIEALQGWDKSVDMAIGSDDWSVAGFDIGVQLAPESPTILRQSQQQMLPQVASQENQLNEVLEKAGLGSFGLSPNCNAFWKNTLSTMSEPCSSLKLLQDMFGVQTLGLDRVTTQKEATVVTRDASPPYRPSWYVSNPRILRERDESGSSKRPWYLRWTFTVPALLIIPIVVGLIVYYPQLDARSDSGTNNSESRSSPEVLNPLAKLTTPSQIRIYERLRDNKPYIEDALPSGDNIGAPRIETFLADLAEVLKATQYAVTIEVYSDFQGPSWANQQTSERRASRISANLQNDRQIPSRQLEMVSRGIMDRSSLAYLDSQAGRPISTSGAIIVVHRRS